MDDGLQDSSIKKDYTYCLVSSSYGNNLPLPAGPLRELRYFAKNRINEYVMQEDLEITYSIDGDRLNIGQDCVAFCGIATPDEFKNALAEVGLNIVKFYEFPDHHIYTVSELDEMLKSDLPVVTTKKDYVKLERKYASKIHVVNKKVVLPHGMRF